MHPPARSISKTVPPSGMVLLEIGDEVMTLTPREDRTLGSLKSGAATQFSQVEAGHQMAVLVTEVKRKLSELGAMAPGGAQ